jgi:D-cysteine desulfhydrase
VPELPLVRRFSALATLPRASLGNFPTPVEAIRFGGASLFVKRDDLSGGAIGGNKLRGLEWLLGDVASGDEVLTVGPAGSTHALATARCARLIGAGTTVVRWKQEMNTAARRVDELLRREARVLDSGVVPLAYARALTIRLSSRVRWIPAGGATPRAILGHVNGALELADQIARGDCERPERVCVPLGTGGTAAGIALGFRIAGLETKVIAVRVVPRIVGRSGRVVRLAHRTAALIERLTGSRLPRLRRGDIVVDHKFYGGGYGRPLPESGAAGELARAGIRVDDTYSRKALAAAVARSHGTLLWLTFDGRLLQD